ncbi:MAG: hypothetical protein K6F23_03615 [Solobacterium sp.]|nr:hypothetical protein [Solobacterium sp.]
MTHRKVTGYSLLAYIENIPNFVQGSLSSQNIWVCIDALLAYASDDTSGLVEHESQGGVGSPFDLLLLYDSNGIPYHFIPMDENEDVAPSAYGYGVSFPNYIGYRYQHQITGTVTNDEVGMAVANWLDANGYDLTYNANGKKVFESNEEALRTVMLYLFMPLLVFSGSTPSYYVTGYKPIPAVTNRFAPSFYGANDDLAGCKLYAIGHTTQVQFRKGSSANRYASGFSWQTLEMIQTGNYQVDASMNTYTMKSVRYPEDPDWDGKDTLHMIPIQATLQIENVFMYGGKGSASKDKWYYGSMYGYGNAYSLRDLLDGWAELNGAFIHSERDGTISMETLDNSSPYSITASDVDGSVWWDEYNVLPIGTIKYTFTNPYTEQVESGSIRISDNPSVYDLSGNKILESMDFRAKKLASLSDYMDPRFFYIYQGNFYYTEDGTQYTLGGMYKDVTSIVEFVIRKLFVPHVPYVNFTPMEMALRGLPYLEAGDAITFEAEDGTTIESYVLNHTFGGIQYIQEQVTSVAGDVI